MNSDIQGYVSSHKFQKLGAIFFIVTLNLFYVDRKINFIQTKKKSLTEKK